MWRSDRPLVLGHRGASASAPQNTLEAFLLASEQGADGIELDVRRTSDGVDVVHHDPGTASGRILVATSFEELRASEPAIPTLAEVLDRYPGIVNIEIKNSPIDPDFDPGQTVAARVAEAVESRGLADRVIVSSFNPVTLVALEKTQLELGLLLPAGTDMMAVLRAAASLPRLTAVHPFDADVHEPDKIVEAAAASGMRLVVWTVDSRERINELASAGVDAIITNDPATAIAALSNLRN